MVHGQTQSLLLERNQRRRALLAARNFALGSPERSARRHGATARRPTDGGHGAPDALPETPRERLVRRDGVGSLAHIPVRVAPCPAAALRSQAHLGLGVWPVSPGLTVMLRFCALKEQIIGKKDVCGLRLVEIRC